MKGIGTQVELIQKLKDRKIIQAAQTMFWQAQNYLLQKFLFKLYEKNRNLRIWNTAATPSFQLTVFPS